MQNTQTLKKKLEYARFTHLLIVYMIALILYLFSTIPHKWWILLTVLVVSSGIEPGLILKRAKHRLRGTFLALMLLIPLLYVLQLNYRLIPVIFILASIGMAIASLNSARYHVRVFFMTLVVFFLIAQTIDDITPEGPFEMAMNRGICTLMGVSIVMLSDFFLFHAYQYSQKLYLFHQLMIYDFLQECGKQIQKARADGTNSIVFIERLRNNFIENFSLITISSESLMFDLKASEHMKQQVLRFQKTIWEIRRLIFALSFSEVILPAQANQAHWQQYKALLKKAQQEMISLE